jgi:hypothetical protein
MTRTQKIAHNRAEARIERAYTARCQGVQISIMKIPDVFKFGHRVIAEGADDATLGDKIAAYVAEITKAESGK